MSKTIKYVGISAIGGGIGTSLLGLILYSFYYLDGFWKIAVITISVIFSILEVIMAIKFDKKNKNLYKKKKIQLITFIAALVIFFLISAIFLNIVWT